MENLGIDPSSINILSKKIINHKIQILNLSNNSIGDESIWMLLDFLQKNTELKSISLRNCKLTGQGIWPLLNIIGSRDFDLIDISENNIGSLGADYISQFLDTNPNIKFFYLDNTQLSSGDVEMLFDHVNRCTNITKFSMTKNSLIAFREKSQKIIVDMMKQME